MNYLQEWALRFVVGRERNGERTKGKDLFEASYSVSPNEVQELVDEGYLTLEQTNVIPSLQNAIGISTYLNLTEKSREYFKNRKPN